MSETHEAQTINAHRLAGDAQVSVEDIAFHRGLTDYRKGRIGVSFNPYQVLFEPDAYEAWGIGQDAGYVIGLDDA